MNQMYSKDCWKYSTIRMCLFINEDYFSIYHTVITGVDLFFNIFVIVNGVIITSGGLFVIKLIPKRCVFAQPMYYILM